MTKVSMPGARLTGSTLDGMRGAGSLSRAVIGAVQVMPFALALFTDLGITIDD